MFQNYCGHMIAINAQTESAILKMLSSNAEEIIQTLAEKYEFDADEARRVCELPTHVTKPKPVPRKAKSDEEKPKKGKDSAQGLLALRVRQQDQDGLVRRTREARLARGRP